MFFDNGGNNKNWIKADAAESLIFGTNNSTNVTIKEGGNVGIGITAPSTKLDVAGNANISDTLAIGSLSTVPTASLGRALNIQVLANSSGTTVAQWLDIDRTITTDSTSAATWGMVLRNASTTTSTANDGKIYGAQIIGRHQGTGGIESAMGVRSTADINTTGTITTTGTLWGAYNEAQVTNGSVTFANSGIFGSASRGQVLGSGTVNITSQGVVGGALIGVLNNVNASVNRVVGGEFELDLQNGTTDKAHVVSLNTFNIVSPTNLSIDEFAYIYLGEDVAIPTTITDNAYFIKSLTSLPSELAGSIEATSFIKTGGTSSQFLKADGSIDSTSYAPATGGSYLPLTAGSSYPLTGTLYLGNVGGDQKIQFQRTGGNVYSIEHDSAQLYFYNRTTTEAPLVIQNDGDVLMNAGNVGIGTTSPGGLLHIHQTGSGTSNSIITEDDARKIFIGRDSIKATDLSDNAAMLYLQQHGGNATFGNDISLGGNLTLTTNARYLRAEDSAGATTRLLGINGSNSTYIGPIDAYAGGSVFYGVSANVSSHTLYTGASARLHINSSGNVGIGTTSPSEKLEVSGSNTLSIKLSRNNTDATYVTTLTNNYSSTLGTELKSGAYNILTHGNSTGTALNFTNGAMTFDFRNSEHMRITEAGNVGIGTASPLKTLSVNGGDIAVNNGNGFIVGAAITGNTEIGRLSASSGQLQILTESTRDIKFGSTTYGNIMFLEGTNGNVGIGTTSPDEKLEVSGNVQITTGGNTYLNVNHGNVGFIKFTDTSIATPNQFLIQHNYAQDNDFRIARATGGQDFVIDSSGNVGIGTASPNYKLTVSGGISAGGKVTYSKSAGSLNTTGYAVAGLLASYNGQSACFTFTAIGNAGHYQKVVYSCWNTSGTWNTSKVIDEGTNGLDIEASVNASTITFTFKSRSGSLNYTPRVTVEASGSAINSTYA